ncbi:MAG: GNAT family N-acetyltransferase [Oscillospiraceae bacterium]|nr:GNAT family N-acetyltransferase [Oscillospiraceae bacterium]
MGYRYIWTDGNDEVFRHFYLITEEYYSSVAGGEEKRRAFIPYNVSSGVEIVLLVFCGDTPVACSGLKRYSDNDAEIKRVWVEPGYRGDHIATEMMELLEDKAKVSGFSRMILQTREIMTDAVRLYTRLGYERIGNYPPYDKLDGAICFAKKICE